MGKLTLNISIITPVHVGDGDRIPPALMMHKDGRLYILSSDALRTVLTTPQLVTRFTQWLWERQNRGRSIEHFVRDVLRNERLLETLCANASYSLKCFLPLKGRWRDLHTLIKLPSEGAMAYIPGSEIKGAMRTALLWWLLRNDAQLRNWLHNALKQFKRQFANALDGVHGRDIREKIPVNVIPEEELNKLKQRRLRIKSGRVSVSNLKFALARILERDVTQKLERRAFRGSVSIDAQYDALRVIQIGDSSVVPQDYLAVIPIVIIGLSSDLELWHEAIMPGAKITSSFRAPTDEDALWSQMTAQFGYSGKLCEALSSVERLFSILHEFSQAVLQDDAMAFQMIGRNNSANVCERLQKFSSAQKPLLRIGKNIGYLSHTIGLAIREMDESLYGNVVQATTGKSYRKFPKTRRIVQIGGKVAPMGWIQLELA